MKNDNIRNIFSFVALDIETTGFNPEENEIIEIGAVYFEDGQEKARFSEFVKPKKQVPDFIKQLTHISDEQLASGISAYDALSKLKDFISDKIIVCHNASFDIEFINFKLSENNISRIHNSIFDTLIISRIYLPFLKNHKLSSLTKHFSVNLDNAHRAIYDAEATGKILLELLSEVEKVPLPINNQLSQFADKAQLDYDFSEFLDSILAHQRRYALLRKKELPRFINTNYIKHEGLQSNTEAISEIFRDGGIISQKMENFEVREGQVQMAEAIEKAFNEKSFLLVEAGTGVGKSLAYLLPAIQHSVRNDQKVVISTNTKNLQEQLFYKDLPFLKKVLPVGFTSVLLKGRDNYLCERKWQELFFDIEKSIGQFEAKELLNLVIWKEKTQTGDVTENNSFNKQRNSSLWKRVAADRHFCTGKKCSFYRNCYLMDIRKKSEDANVLVVNHSLLLADIKNENATIGAYDYLVIDEAHNLPQIAASHLGFSFAYPDVNSFLQQLYNIRSTFQSGVLPTLKSAVTRSGCQESQKEFFKNKIEQIIEYIDEKKYTFESFFKEIAKTVELDGSYGKLRIKVVDEYSYVIDKLKDFEEVFNYIFNNLTELYDNLSGINSAIFNDYDKNLTNIEGSIQQTGELMQQISILFNPDLENNAFWMSTLNRVDKKYPAGILNLAPLEVNTILANDLYDNIESIVFTSATLAIRNVFKFFKSRIGLNLLKDKVLEEKIVTSPFDYNSQAKALVTSFLPDPKDKFFSIQSTNIIKNVIKKAKVGSLVLFTSYRDLNLLYDNLSEDFYKNDILFLAQGKGASRSALVEEFKEHGSGVLLGTNSFWEGVDIQGDSLSLLILYKLPFQVPSEPVVEAYLEKLEAQGKNSFMHYMLPNALLKYRQGFGRLIRSKSDKGIVLILDNRVSKKFYGKYFSEIIPARTIYTYSDIEVYDHVGKWFKSIFK